MLGNKKRAFVIRALTISEQLSLIRRSLSLTCMILHTILIRRYTGITQFAERCHILYPASRSCKYTVYLWGAENYAYPVIPDQRQLCMLGMARKQDMHITTALAATSNIGILRKNSSQNALPTPLPSRLPRPLNHSPTSPRPSQCTHNSFPLRRFPDRRQNYPLAH
jgi:hypothetical protein